MHKLPENMHELPQKILKNIVMRFFNFFCADMLPESRGERI